LIRVSLVALADVEAARTLDHAEIEAWAEGLEKSEALSPPVSK
jgi:hypothetical protein